VLGVEGEFGGEFVDGGWVVEEEDLWRGGEWLVSCRCSVSLSPSSFFFVGYKTGYLGTDRGEILEERLTVP